MRELGAKNSFSEDQLIQVKRLSKKFSKDLRKSLWYGSIDFLRDMAGFRKGTHLRDTEFWAVNDISFEVNRGDCVGLIGYNGAGKSTVLKMLNGLISPDKGEVILKGNVGALIELGAGFNPLLTGRENVFNYGVILGFTHREIEELYPEIVAFAELDTFMETPVMNYSSGMKARLGFAVASQMNPDILIVDEVLSVGDLGFKKKCFERMAEMMKDTAVIIVSHSLPQILRLCNRVIVLSEGKIELNTTDISAGVEHYYKRFKSNSTVGLGENLNVFGITFQNRNVLNKKIIVEFDKSLEFEILFEILKPIERYQIGIMFIDSNQNPVAVAETSPIDTNGKNQLTHKVRIPKITFGSKRLTLSMDFYQVNRDGRRVQIHSQHDACNMNIFNTPYTAKAPMIIVLEE